DEVRLSLAHPDRGLPGSADPRRPNAEVEVREMRDAQPVELRRQLRHLELELSQARPACLEQAPTHAGTGEARAGERAASQTSRRSSAGRGSTMWRLNFSSASSRPAATPTSCARWSTGSLN